MPLNPFDAISAVLVFISYSKIGDLKAAAARREEMRSKIDDDKKTYGATGQWTEAMEKAHGDLTKSLIREDFSSWFSVNTPVAAACGGFISYACGISTVPGALIGFLISSPRFWGLMIQFFHLLGGGQRGG